MHLHAYISLPLDPYPGIRAWMARVEALPCWENTDVVPLLGLDAQS
jgi:glutathione S-transferase